MCLAFVLALILLPLFAGGIGYARYGAAGGAIGALGGLAAALVLVGGPMIPLLSAERKKLARDKARWVPAPDDEARES